MPCRGAAGTNLAIQLARDTQTQKMFGQSSMGILELAVGYFDGEACEVTEVQGATTPASSSASLSIAFWNEINRLGSLPKAAGIADVSGHACPLLHQARSAIHASPLCLQVAATRMIGAVCNLTLHSTQQTRAFESSFALSDQAYCASTGAVAVVALVSHEQQ